MERRGEVIEYVRQKIRYARRQPDRDVRHAVPRRPCSRDVCRVLGMSYGDGDRLSKMIPIEARQTAAAGVGGGEKTRKLKKAIETEPGTRQVWGPCAHPGRSSRAARGVHAAGRRHRRPQSG